jgi:hypothetical protein
MGENRAFHFAREIIVATVTHHAAWQNMALIAK